jgi:hypothetical protein
MTTKADFNAEEWATLVEGPLLAALRVVAAERGGTIRESLAIGRAYAEARRHHGDSPLLDEIVASPPSIDPQQLQASGDLDSHASARLAAAVSTADSKATSDEARAYKEFVLTVAEAAANANREGGFAGIGGKPVSAAEQAVLDELRQALGLSA